MKIFITGAGGFIATHLVHFLRSHGHDIDGGTSRELRNEDYRNLFVLKLGYSLPVLNEQYDWIIHCAYDHASSAQHNYEATILWADEFQRQGTLKQLFISTIGVVSGNTSEYALAKAQTEEWFRKHQMYIIRPGLVVGNGGLFKRMLEKVQSFPILPLIDGGNQKVKLIGIVDLSESIEKIVNTENHLCREENLFYPNEATLSEILQTLAQFYKRKVIFISIPFRLIYLLVWCIEKLHLNIGISTVNLIGLQENEWSILSNIKYDKSLKECFEGNLK